MHNAARMITAVILLVGALTICTASPASALEQVTLQLKWIHQFQFAGYYAAKQQGYYRDAGLDVTILPATPGKDPVLDVIDGKAQYGVGTSSLLLLRNSGKPVVALAVIFQHSPYILLTKEHFASQTIHNLAGKRLMLEPQADELVAYLRKEGMPIEKMRLVEHSFNTNDLIDGKVDVISGYVTDDPHILEQAGYPYHAYTPRSAGIDFYGDNLFTTEGELRNHPARAKAFREASLKGWHYAMQHPDEIIELIIKTYAAIADREHLKYEAEQIRQLIQPNLVEIGYMHAGRWRHIAETYNSLGMLPRNVDIQKIMYNPHPNKDLTPIYWTASTLLGLALMVIALRLIKISRNLKVSEEKFFKAFENAPVMKTISNMDNCTFLNVNAKFCEMTGYSKEYVIGKSSLEIGILTPPDRQKLTDAMSLSGGFSGIKLKVHTAAGFVMDCVYFGEIVQVGRQKQLFTVILDVTEQLQSIEQVRKLSQAVEQSPVTIMITDAQGNIEFVNSQFTKLTGYTFEEVLGKTPRILKSGDNPPELYLQLWQRIISGETWEGEIHNQKKNGELFWEHAVISPLRDADGMITHFIGIKEDITEQRMLMEQLQQSQKMEAVGQLAGGLAHDFNNVLSVINGYCSLVHSEVEHNPKLSEYLEHVLAASNRAADLTHSLLAFSRTQVMNKRQQNLNMIVQKMWTFTKRIIREDINFRTIANAASLPVHVDSGQIEQIVINLVTNARDAMPDGGELTIVTDLQNIDDLFISQHGFGVPSQYALLSVIDTGKGMDAETRKKIFEPFFTTKEVGKGTGLGLAMVYGITKQHDGFVDVHSEPGKGASFMVYLPIVEPKDTVIKEEKNGKIETPGGSETILIAEDDNDLREFVTILLTKLGYRVIFAVDGEDAVVKFRENADAIQLIIMDMIMPSKSGKQAYEEIRQIRPNTKALFSSGYSAQLIKQQGELGKYAQFISKPVQPDIMARKIREMLDQDFG